MGLLHDYFMMAETKSEASLNLFEPEPKGKKKKKTKEGDSKQNSDRLKTDSS
jgi:hypothetical protein